MTGEYHFLFFTHTGAIKFDRAMKKRDIPCQLMPVPRALSSNCSVSAQIFTKVPYESLLDDQVEKVFHFLKESYILVYEAPE